MKLTTLPQSTIDRLRCKQMQKEGRCEMFTTLSSLVLQTLIESEYFDKAYSREDKGNPVGVPVASGSPPQLLSFTPAQQKGD